MDRARLRPAVLLALMALLLAACGPAASTAPPGGEPAVSGTAAGPEWDALVAAAREEGTVVVLGPPTTELRRLPEAFQKRFGINLEYTGQASSDFAARLQAERSAGIYSADVVISGSNSMYEVLAGRGQVENGVMGMLAPLRPALILPEVLDTAKYRMGKLIFMDPAEQYV